MFAIVRRKRFTRTLALTLALPLLAVLAPIGSAGAADGSPGIEPCRPVVGEQFTLCVPVLTYHRIAPASEAADALPSMVVSPYAFEAHMDALHRAGWHTITLAALADLLAERAAPPPRTFVITIDDGWYDGYKYAFPILRSRGFVATYFVIAHRIGREYTLSHGEMAELLAAGNEIGSHAARHRPLAGLPPDELVREVHRASDEIESAIGVRPVSFAYPMGSISDLAAKVVGECPGIRIGVSTRVGIGANWQRRFIVPRLGMGPDTAPRELLSMLEPGVA